VSDFKIANPTGSQYGLVLEDGDLVLMDEDADLAEVVAQRVVYELMTWQGESVYDQSAGQPHLDVLGSFAGFEGIAGIYALAIQETDGVDEITDFDFTQPDVENGYTLTVSAMIRAGRTDAAIALQIGAPA
jgi:hypothetical protein